MSDAAGGPVGGPVELDGGTVLARVLAAAGVTELFGVVGGKLTPFLGAVDADPRLRWTGVRHEAAAAWMATAVAHGTGRLAACVAEVGPGAQNLASGLLTARNNHLPVLAITSTNPTTVTRPDRGMFMDADGQATFAPLAKFTARATSPARIADVVRTAIRAALTGRPGPVHVEVPVDVLAAKVRVDEAALDLPLAAWCPAGPSGADAALVDRAAALLATARRPLIVAGGGVVASQAAGAVRSLAARLGAPVLPTQMGIGTVASDDPHFIGHGGVVFGESFVQALQEADVVLAVGCRFSSWTWQGLGPALGAPGTQQLVQIDVEPAAIGAAAPVAVGLVGDAEIVVSQLLAVLAGATASDGPAAWRASLVATYAGHRAQLHALADDVDRAAGQPMHPATLARRLGQLLPADALVVYDGGHTTFWSNDLTPVHEPRTRFHDPGAAHLGFGAPYAHALARVHPDTLVVNITGDGAFGFTLNELDTARRYGLRVVHVIHDNAAWGIIRAAQSRAGFDLATGLDGTDYAAIARGFGCHGERVEQPGELDAALGRAVAAASAGTPAVLDVVVRFAPHPGLGRFAAIGRAPEPG